MKMTELLVYGKHRVSGKMIFIDDAMNGKKCNCVCAGCGEVLIARQGESNDAHFAHANGDQCGYSGESALHQLAKQIIEENKMMRLPDGTLFKYSDAAIEKTVMDYRPDAILTNGNDVLHIEIFVTHKVGFNKSNFLFEKGLKTVEINLSDLSRTILKTELEQIIVEDISRKQCITQSSDLSLFGPPFKDFFVTDAEFADAFIYEVEAERVYPLDAQFTDSAMDKGTPWHVKILGIVFIFLFAKWMLDNPFSRNRY